MKQFLFIIFLTITLTACSDNYEKYIGYYIYTSSYTGFYKIIEIKKEGDSYLIRDGHNSSFTPLKKSDEGFEVYTGKIILSEDNETLYFSGVEAKRFAPELLDEYIKKVKDSQKIGPIERSEPEGMF